MRKYEVLMSTRAASRPGEVPRLVGQSLSLKLYKGISCQVNTTNWTDKLRQIDRQ